MQPQFIGPSYNLESRPASVQRTVNLIPVPLEPGNERTAWEFEDIPGLLTFSTGIPRGAYANEDGDQYTAENGDIYVYG